MSVCANFHGNPLNSCSDILVRAKVVGQPNLEGPQNSYSRVSFCFSDSLYNWCIVFCTAVLLVQILPALCQFDLSALHLLTAKYTHFQKESGKTTSKQ